MNERDEFDRIVEHLDLDVSFPEQGESDRDRDRDDGESERGDRRRSHPSSGDDQTRWSRSPDERSDEGDDAFYKHPAPGPARPWRWSVVAAWAAVVGAPLTLVVCTVIAYIVPRSVLAALALAFVAGSVYLISQLPDQGPGRGDDPDDGAVL